jgi:hypothetical protein
VSSKPNSLQVQCSAVAMFHPIQSLNINEQIHGVIFFTIFFLNKLSKYLLCTLRCTHRTYCFIHQLQRWCHGMWWKVSSVYLDNYRKTSSNIIQHEHILEVHTFSLTIYFAL